MFSHRQISWPRVNRLIASLLFALLLGGCQGGETGLQGELLFADQPLAGASLEVYLKSGKDRTVQPFAVGRSEVDGRFALQLPSGRYYLIAKQRQTTADGRTRMLMAECPGNPIEVGKGITRIPAFSLHEMGRDGQLVADAGTDVHGRLTVAGEPLAGAMIYVYTEAAAGEMGPSYGEAVESGMDGSFRIPLPGGQYWLAARKRADGARLGELQPGDLNGRYPGNPVQVKKGERLALNPFPLHQIESKQLQKRQAEGKFVTTETAFVGRVVDADGQAVAGVYLFAYLDSRMVGKPTYISDPTGEDGGYRLNLGSGGTFFLGARSAFGGPLEPGEWVGTYDTVPDHRAEIEAGRVRQLEKIEVREVW